MANVYRSVQIRQGIPVDSIAVTTMPTKVSYGTGDRLDTTGIVVTATADLMTGDVSSLCEYSPTILNTEGTQVITVTYGGKSTSFSVTVVSTIYGVEWDKSISSALTRTDASTNFTDPVPYYEGMLETPSSPFDNLLPWSEIETVEDLSAGTLVKIPKYYFKWTVTESSVKLQISPNEFEGSHVSPAHANRYDGKGERDYVYVGAHLCATDTYKSQSDVLPQKSVSMSDFRTNIHSLGSTIWIYDFAMHMTIAMLYLVEYADWNTQTKIGYGCSENFIVENTGACDDIPYHTGTNMTSRTTYGHTIYRYIEDMWGNLYVFTDGLRHNLAELYASNNPSEYGLESFNDWVNLNMDLPHSSGGTTTDWQVCDEEGFEYCLIPKSTIYDETKQLYTASYYYVNIESTDNKYFKVGRSFNKVLGRGMFSLEGEKGQTASSCGARLQKLP